MSTSKYMKMYKFWYIFLPVYWHNCEQINSQHQATMNPDCISLFPIPAPFAFHRFFHFPKIGSVNCHWNVFDWKKFNFLYVSHCLSRLHCAPNTGEKSVLFFAHLPVTSILNLNQVLAQRISQHVFFFIFFSNPVGCAHKPQTTIN